MGQSSQPTLPTHFCILVVACICGTVGLKCLQCMDPRPLGPCAQDFATQVNTSLEIFPNNSLTRPYYKECLNSSNNYILNPNITQNYCVIEEFYSGGDLKSFIRDCSDGLQFSFTGVLKYDKLKEIAPDNFTTCLYHLAGNLHVCITLCEGDFCNAPRPPRNVTKNETCIDQNGENTTCRASSTLFRHAHGLLVFGSTVDGLLGHVIILPILVSLVCALLVA